MRKRHYSLIVSFVRRKIGRRVIFRLSSIPSKQLVYLLLQRDRRLSKGRQVGVDFGCRRMGNYPVFRTVEYYGIDLDKRTLARGVAKYPQAVAVHAKIEEANVPQADFAHCISVFKQVSPIGVNQTVLLKRIISKLRQGGVLLITFQNNKELNTYRSILNKNFKSVDEFLIDATLSAKKSNFISLLTAVHSLLLNKKSKNYKKIYCKCVGRI